MATTVKGKGFLPANLNHIKLNATQISLIVALQLKKEAYLSRGPLIDELIDAAIEAVVNRKEGLQDYDLNQFYQYDTKLFSLLNCGIVDENWLYRYKQELNRMVSQNLSKTLNQTQSVIITALLLIQQAKRNGDNRAVDKAITEAITLVKNHPHIELNDVMSGYISQNADPGNQAWLSGFKSAVESQNQKNSKTTQNLPLI